MTSPWSYLWAVGFVGLRWCWKWGRLRRSNSFQTAIAVPCIWQFQCVRLTPGRSTRMQFGCRRFRGRSFGWLHGRRIWGIWEGTGAQERSVHFSGTCRCLLICTAAALFVGWKPKVEQEVNRWRVGWSNSCNWSCLSVVVIVSSDVGCGYASEIVLALW